jgi:hypothetical protein
MLTYVNVSQELLARLKLLIVRKLLPEGKRQGGREQLTRVDFLHLMVLIDGEIGRHGDREHFLTDFSDKTRLDALIFLLN